ncbi:MULTISPECIES: pilin [Nocardia]|uniref:pilin n=1 Tax=Nocardia TaxID=1817 RepID=UPI000AA6E54A|nr:MULTISPECIES: pilin [Nocardia]
MRMNRFPTPFSTVETVGRHGRTRRWHRAAACVVLVALTLLTVAAAGPASAQPVSLLAIASSLDQVIDNARNWLVGISSAVATVCLTIAGVRYVIASGDPAEVEKSKSALRAACLGYALAMLAPVIVAVLKSIVGA